MSTPLPRTVKTPSEKLADPANPGPPIVRLVHTTGTSVETFGVVALAVFDGSDAPASLTARTRYVYRVLADNPVWLYDVAPAGTESTEIHVEPLSRWMRNSVSLLALSTQLKLIRVEEAADALRF